MLGVHTRVYKEGWEACGGYIPGYMGGMGGMRGVHTRIYREVGRHAGCTYPVYKGGREACGVYTPVYIGREGGLRRIVPSLFLTRFTVGQLFPLRSLMCTTVRLVTVLGPQPVLLPEAGPSRFTVG